jgi:two-component system, OmpR family, sensor histidine kinase KdpD
MQAIAGNAQVTMRSLQERGREPGAMGTAEREPMSRRQQRLPGRAPSPWRQLLARASAALGAVAVITALIHLLPGAAHITNISFLYLLAVIGTALWFGRASAVAASILAFLAFDFFFTRPRFTFTVHDPAEWLALCMFLLTATVTGQLTALLQARAEEARQREREAAALAEASWAVASRVDRNRALDEVLRRLMDVLQPRAAAIFVPAEQGDRSQAGTREAGDGDSKDAGSEASLLPSPASRVPACDLSPGSLAPVAARGEDAGETRGAACGAASEALQFVMEHGSAIGWGGENRHCEKALAETAHPNAAYLPLIMEGRVLGALHLRLRKEQRVTPEERRVVESLANHAAVVLERDRLARAETHARALAEADRLKTALLSMVSHDFRSPLASIKASASAMLGEGAPVDAETQRELLTGIEQETDRLNRMVGNILALSRLEADAWRPRCEATAPAEMVGAALQAFGPEQNRRIQVSLDPALAEVWLDPVQIVQVLHNLVDNALKYSPADEPVELSVRRQGDRLVAEVLDRGPGVPPGDEERVFERFYRAPGLRESAVPGVGIGLAVCRGLVEAHGGQLTAHNRPGGGAVFRLALPLHR